MIINCCLCEGATDPTKTQIVGETARGAAGLQVFDYVQFFEWFVNVF